MQVLEHKSFKKVDFGRDSRMKFSAARARLLPKAILRERNGEGRTKIIFIAKMTKQECIFMVKMTKMHQKSIEKMTKLLHMS